MYFINYQTLNPFLKYKIQEDLSETLPQYFKENYRAFNIGFLEGSVMNHFPFLSFLAYCIYFINHHNGIIETSWFVVKISYSHMHAYIPIYTHIYTYIHILMFLYETLHFMKWIILHNIPTYKDITMSLQGSLTLVHYLPYLWFLFCCPP